ncbi:hypothetical protein HK101_010766 [Irineochytrium annulatum]|nr:hypothetical protein HK101_010766 [Irineochytrium annulatum]
MPRSEFAAPLVQIKFDYHAFPIPVRDLDADATYRVHQNIPLVSPLFADEASRQEKQHLLAGTQPDVFKPPQSVPMLTDPQRQPDDPPLQVGPINPFNAMGAPQQSCVFGRVTLSPDVLKEKPGEPLLQITLVGREHVDVFSRDGAQDSMHVIFEHTETMAWKPFVPGQTVPNEYDFRIALPDWLPASASPTWGAIDYRLTAKFLVPEGKEEVMAQKRVDIVRMHHDSMLDRAGTISKGMLGKNGEIELTMKAPKVAAMDGMDKKGSMGGSALDLAIALRVASPEEVGSIRSVRVNLYEIRSYSHIQVIGGAQEKRSKDEIISLGDHHLSAADIKSFSVNPPQPVNFTLKFGDARSDSDIPVVMHPQFKAQNMSVRHEIGVRVVYASKAHGAPAKGGIFKMFSSAAAMGPDVTVMGGVPIMMVRTRAPIRIGE